MRAPDKIQALQVLRARNIPIETIVDVGVQTETPELRRVFRDKKHILFEPVAEFHEAIGKNYRSIQHTLVKAAVGGKDGDGRLGVSSIIAGMKISHSSLVAEAGENVRNIPVVTLDGYFERNPLVGPYLVKIDVDGKEMEIMRGGVETLKRASVVIVETPKNQFTERIAFLLALDFEIFDLSEPCYYDKSFWQCDAVMIAKPLQRQYFSQLGDGFVPDKYELFSQKDTKSNVESASRPKISARRNLRHVLVAALLIALTIFVLGIATVAFS